MQKLNSKAFTLIELTMTILVISIFAGLTTYFVDDNMNSVRYELTRKKMEAIRTAILGDGTVDSQGNLVNFGYNGDMGALPTALTDLAAIGAQAAYAFDTTTGVGTGWRGPYITSQYTTSYAVDKDEWGPLLCLDTGSRSSNSPELRFQRRCGWNCLCARYDDDLPCRYSLGFCERSRLRRIDNSKK